MVTPVITSPAASGPWTQRRDVACLAALLALGGAVRAPYLLLPVLDSDQAIVGLMGRHILAGEFPIFFWGQHFAGTLEAHLAAVPFYLFGASRLTLALSPFLFSLSFLLVTYRLGRESFGREAGLLALLLAAVSAPLLVHHSVTARANYIENLVLGSLVLLLALRLERVNALRGRALRREVYALYLACRDPRAPWYAKAVAGVIVAHAFSPIDLIPDFIPVLG